MKLILSLLMLEAVITSSAMAQPSQDCTTPRFDNPAYCVLRRPLSVAVGDLDGDGVTNNIEEDLGLDRFSIDSDGDGVPEAQRFRHDGARDQWCFWLRAR